MHFEQLYVKVAVEVYSILRLIAVNSMKAGSGSLLFALVSPAVNEMPHT